MRRTLAAALTALLLATPVMAEPSFAPTPRAVVADPARDPKTPADMAAFTLSTGGVAVNAVMYLASGDKPHPTMLFLHGFPGNETNIDLMQAVRRAGWNVLKINYRGSWGSPGDFSFANARADGEAAVAFLRDPANVAKYRIDPARIVVAGHSMGGFMAASASAARPDVAGTILIDAWNIGGDDYFAKTDPKVLAGEIRADTIPLAGTSPEALIAEIAKDKAKLDLAALSREIAKRPVLLIGADHGIGMMTKPLAAAAREVSAANTTEIHLPSDHSFSDARIALASEVVRWLGQFDPASAVPGRRPMPLTAAYDPQNVFARIIRGELPAWKVYEDAEVLAFMDRAPMEAGHVLVISKTSTARNILDMDPKDLARVMAIAQKVGQAEVDGLGVEGFMILQNNGVGQSVPHLHVHVIPRVAGKQAYLVENAPGDPKEIEAIAAKLRAAIR